MITDLRNFVRERLRALTRMVGDGDKFDGVWWDGDKYHTHPCATV